MKNQFTTTATTLFFASLLAFGCEFVDDDRDFSGDDPADEEIWDVDVEDPAETSDDLPDGLQAAATDSCGGRRFIGLSGIERKYGRGDATINFSRKNGVTWVHDVSYRVTNDFHKGQRIGLKWQVFRNGKWRNAADWMFYRRDVGAGSKTIGNGIRTNLPTRVQVLFQWEFIGPDYHKTCYIRTS